MLILFGVGDWRCHLDFTRELSISNVILNWEYKLEKYWLSKVVISKIKVSFLLVEKVISSGIFPVEICYTTFLFLYIGMSSQ